MIVNLTFMRAIKLDISSMAQAICQVRNKSFDFDDLAAALKGSHQISFTLMCNFLLLLSTTIC